MFEQPSTTPSPSVRHALQAIKTQTSWTYLFHMPLLMNNLGLDVWLLWWDRSLHLPSTCDVASSACPSSYQDLDTHLFHTAPLMNNLRLDVWLLQWDLLLPLPVILVI